MIFVIFSRNVSVAVRLCSVVTTYVMLPIFRSTEHVECCLPLTSVMMTSNLIGLAFTFHWRLEVILNGKKSVKNKRDTANESNVPFVLLFFVYVFLLPIMKLAQNLAQLVRYW